MFLLHVNWESKKQNKVYSMRFCVWGELISYISNGLVKFCCLSCKILKIQDKEVLPCFKSDQFYYVHY